MVDERLAKRRERLGVTLGHDLLGEGGVSVAGAHTKELPVLAPQEVAAMERGHDEKRRLAFGVAELLQARDALVAGRHSERISAVSSRSSHTALEPERSCAIR